MNIIAIVAIGLLGGTAFLAAPVSAVRCQANSWCDGTANPADCHIEVSWGNTAKATVTDSVRSADASSAWVTGQGSILTTCEEIYFEIEAPWETSATLFECYLQPTLCKGVAVVWFNVDGIDGDNPSSFCGPTTCDGLKTGLLETGVTRSINVPDHIVIRVTGNAVARYWNHAGVEAPPVEHAETVDFYVGADQVI